MNIKIIILQTFKFMASAKIEFLTRSEHQNASKKMSDTFE